jgi:hypothetical protein
MAIYLGALLSGCSFGFLILHTTFVHSSPLRESSVHIWGFRAPLGAFIATWGCIMMLTSAPFDNWWHEAYGLDVKIISPPHIVLFLGIYAIIIGTMILISGHMNRATGIARRHSRWMFLYVAGIFFTVLMIMLMENTSRAYLHSSAPYIAMCSLVPISLALGWRATRLPFAATAIVGLYTLINISLIQILPLFPAQPKLGPVYQQVTQFIPPQFPILLIVPAIALDLLWRRTASWNLWKIALASGLVFSALLISTEWFFADFLMSPAAANRFFGTRYFYYALPPQSALAHNLFSITESTAQLWMGLVLAAAAAVLSIRWAISRGNWMHEIKR